ncbi:LysR family transcriptional regulator [Parasedimentitalea marina]|uniref:LysR family transcriptional regulator n=1 Tax=Parasedimentitalea marina TaxID=2483033 RepID=A0A3T0N1W6_9RHOB|nr:LysR substrate-binding domain-containing protein [Parasedimentitalea marina]AZV78005.1 LysR family transcriptional regulator [Parasedimentitalea marina]
MWNRIPPIQSLRLFDTVVRHRSMTRAAAETGISQSAVSQSIRQLEDFVDAPLLDRATRPMTLTPAGAEFHRICIETIGRLAHTVEEMRQTNKDSGNTVTVSCNLGFATYWLMPRLNYFSAEHPEIEVHVMVAYQGAAGLHDGSDVAIRYGHGRWADGLWEPLFKETLIPICSPQYLNNHGPIRDAADLASRRLIHVAVTDADWLGWEQYFKLIGHTSTPITGGLRFGNYVQAVQSALTGEGIMLGWRSVVGDLLATQQLTIAYDTPTHLDSGYFVNQSSSRVGSNSTGKLLDWLGRKATETLDF